MCCLELTSAMCSRLPLLLLLPAAAAPGSLLLHQRSHVLVWILLDHDLPDRIGSASAVNPAIGLRNTAFLLWSAKKASS